MALLSFSDILIKAGLDPKRVKLIRHALSDKAFKDNYKIDWDRVVKTRTSATVSCFTQQKDVETELEIVLHAVQNQWNIHDTLVDGASLVQTYQKKYAKKWDDKGIDAIMDDMKKEIETLKKK